MFETWMLRASVVVSLMLFVPATVPAQAPVSESIVDSAQDALGNESTSDAEEKKGEGSGQEDATEGEGRKAEEARDEDGSGAEPDETTPRGVMKLFLKACREGDFAAASSYLDLDASAPSAGSEAASKLAWQLKVVLDQKLWIEPDDLSSEPGGNRDDGLSRRDRVGVIETDRGDVPILLERVHGAGDARVWRISSATVGQIPRLYEKFGYGPIGEYLPEFFFTTSLFRIQLWQGVGLLVIGLLAYLCAWITVLVLHGLIRPAVQRTRTDLDDKILEEAVAPARALVAVMLFAAGALVLHLAVPVQTFLSRFEKAAFALVALWLLLRLVDVFSRRMRTRLENEGRRAAVAVLPMGRRTVKIVIAFLAFISIMQVFGFNVTGLLASLGLGGLAVALAAQRSLENMFAGLSLISDQPVRVGDFCRFGDQLGTVEDIGLRSTKVRTLDRSIVAVPNSQFADLHLENLTRRDYIRFHKVLGLRYETTADQLRYVLIQLRKMLVGHPKVSLEPFWRVRFIGFGDYSLEVEIFVYTRTTDYGEFRAIEEDLLLRIMDIVRDSGTAIAFPSQTAYLGRDSGIDAERGEELEEEVNGLRESGELPFPDFHPDTVDELQDSLSYPPEGTAST